MKIWLFLNLFLVSLISSQNPNRISTAQTIQPTVTTGEKQIVSNQRPCQISAYLIEKNPEGIPVRNAPNPNAQVIKKLPTYDEDTTVVITASQGNWVQISQAEDDDGIVFKGKGWVYASMLGTSTRGYGTRGVSVYTQPNNRSRVVGRIRDQQSVKLLSCDRQWAYVSYEKIQGWLAPTDQCPNALTTCP